MKKHVRVLFCLALLLVISLPLAQPTFADTQDYAVAGEGSPGGCSSCGEYIGGATTYANMNSSDGDTSYLRNTGIASPAGLEYRSWNMADFSETGVINSVVLTYRAKLTHSYCQLTPYVSISGVKYYGTEITPSSGSYTSYTKTWSKNPATVTAWTTATLNAARFGVRFNYSTSPPPVGQASVTYVKLTVNFTPLALPTVDTELASTISCTSATLNGDITSTGGEDADIRGFVWSTSSQSDPGNVAPAGSGYTFNWSEAGTFGTGTFLYYKDSLALDTTYHLRAFAHNSTGYSYGSEESFATWGMPTIITNAATSITVSTARLQSYITDAGGTTCQVRFGWGTNDASDNITAYNGAGSPSAFAGSFSTGASPYLDITGLSDNTTYYFNVEVQNICGSDTGNVVSFDTSEVPMGGIGAPTGVSAISTLSTVVLSWTKGTGASNTFIRFKANACPIDETDGVLIYFGTGSTYTHTNLTSGTDYCYFLISHDSILGYSTDYVIIHATTLAENVPVPVPPGGEGALAKPSGGMTGVPSISSELEENIPLMPFVRAGSVSTGIPMGSFLYAIFLIILMGLSYGIYRWNASIEWIVAIWVVASWIVRPMLHTPLIVPVIVSLIGLGYGAYRIRSLI